MKKILLTILVPLCILFGVAVVKQRGDTGPEGDEGITLKLNYREN